MVKKITDKRVCQVEVVLIFLAIISVCARWQKQYGERKVVIFPFEMIKELPTEPSWYEENVFGDIFKHQDQQTELQEWVESAYDNNIGVVNKSGDPIPLQSLSWNSIDGLTFFQKDGELVIISSDFSGALLRIEVLEKSVHKNKERYCCIIEKLVEEADLSYIDYQNDNTLYYYIDDGKARIQKMDEGVSKIKGFYVNDYRMYPIFMKDSEIYTYILDEAEFQIPGRYSYKIPKKSDSKKVFLKDMNGTCEIEISKDGSFGKLSAGQYENEYVCIYMKGSGLKKVKEGEYEIQEALLLLQNSDISTIEETPSKEYVYLDRDLGYDDNSLW